MQKRIYAVRNGRTVSVYLDGTQHQVDLLEDQEAVDLMKIAHRAKQGDEDSFKELQKQIDPMFVLDIESTDGMLVRTRSGEVFYKNTRVPLPPMLLEAITEAIENDLPYQHLIHFWALCLRNPDSRAREDLFKFLNTYNVPITDMGYFIGYKAVYFRGEKNRYLLEGLSSILINRKINRLSMDVTIIEDQDKNIHVVEDPNMVTAQIKLLDDLEKEKRDHLEAINNGTFEWDFGDEDEDEDLHRIAMSPEQIDAEVREYRENLELKLICNGNQIQEKISEMLENDEADTFTDCHTQTMDIRIGKPVSMSREDCDSDPDRTCSRGLHIGAPGYVKSFGGGKSKAIIACLVNPSDVVAVPKDYSFMKMRTARYYPYAVCELKGDGSVVEIDTKYFEEDFCDYELEELQNMLANGTGEIPGMTQEQANLLVRERLELISVKTVD